MRTLSVILSVFILLLASLVPILSSLAFVGTSSPKSFFRTDVYAFKFDFRNVTFSRFIEPQKYFWNITNKLTVEESGLSQVYTFGLRSYCKGDMIDGKYVPTYCSGNQDMNVLNPHQVFYEDLQNAEDSPLNVNRTYELSFPLRVPNFEGSYYRRSLKTSYYCILVAIIISGVSLVGFAIPMAFPRLRGVYILAFLTSLLSLIMFLAGGGIATKLWADTKDGFRIGSGLYRIKGNWGNGTFWKLLWLAISIQVVLLFCIIMMLCCIDPNKYLDDPMDEEKNIKKKKHKGSKTGKSKNRKQKGKSRLIKHSGGWYSSKKGYSTFLKGSKRQTNTLIQYDVKG